eukprot:TRINITY_DN7671_c1_g1_i3.p1 TRINITY_DN7671_c1_g1~~TRINITY_DN7671_c1_g1_i3.p1  ORF type:complete len:765 (-),score=174.00 TRINITY_DN7671_c1_g1_i3:53-2347(-)
MVLRLQVLLLLVLTRGLPAMSEEVADEDVDSSVLLQQSGLHNEIRTGVDKILLPDATVVNKSLIPDEAEKLMGVKGNGQGDIAVFMSGLVTNVMTALAVAAVFCVLRCHFPLIYSDNVLKNNVPDSCRPSDSWLGWCTVGFKADIDDITDSVGLDSALQLEFANLAIKILLMIGIPSVLVYAPLHAFAGKGGPEVDVLSKVGIANVAEGQHWLYWIHGAGTLGLCWVVKRCIFQAQEKFLCRRFAWLKKLPAPRCRTVLVEGIPQEFRSEEKVREFFSAALQPDAVQDVFLVKQTQVLEGMVAGRATSSENLREAEMELQKTGNRPTHRPILNGSSASISAVDSIDFYRENVSTADSNIALERDRILKESKAQVGGVNCQTAFVTFKDRKDAEIAKELDFSSDADQWVVSEAPELSTVRWSELRTSENINQASQLVGYAAVGGLYVAFMPVCIGTTNIATKLHFGPLWASLAPTIGLTIFLSFLPTVLLAIVNNFFSLKSSQLAQEKLLVWYFWFQVIFVILVTAVGNDFILFVERIIENPMALLHLMADQLPKATHFYMNYLVVQWSTNFINILRYVNLIKFLVFKEASYPEDEAKLKAEPEAQDYYGFGARSARWTTNLLIGIVFSTLSPTIPILAMVNFVCCKVVYGYLIVVAETRKPDLGGHFWVANLRNVMKGTCIYGMLMTGVLLDRAPTPIPGAAAGAGTLYMTSAVFEFDHKFRWQSLPFSEVMYKDKEMLEASKEEDSAAERYEQPELKSVTSKK